MSASHEQNSLFNVLQALVRIISARASKDFSVSHNYFRLLFGVLGTSYFEYV
jgi:hypothetical protein